MQILGKLLAVLMLVRLFFVPRTSGMAIGFILQTVVFVAIGLCGFFFAKFPRKVRVFVCIAFLIPTVFAGFLAIYGNRGTATFDEDVVIVLGAGTNVDCPTSPLARRLDAAVYYFHRNPYAYIIVCGGLGASATITEAEAMAAHLRERGVPPGRILLEDLSTTTLENLMFANEILDAHFPDGFRAVVISNDFHMFRAVSVARRVGMDVTFMGASTPLHLMAENYLREMLAVVNFWVFR